MKKVKIFLLSIFFMCFSIRPISDLIQNTLFINAICVICYITGRYHKAKDSSSQIQIIFNSAIIKETENKETENKETIIILEKLKKNVLQAI